MSAESFRFLITGSGTFIHSGAFGAGSMCGFLETADLQAFCIEWKILSEELTAAPIPVRPMGHFFLPGLSG
jgi:hypothetical protein